MILCPCNMGPKTGNGTRLARALQGLHSVEVFAELNDWFEEFRLYHRKDGRVVKERDDLMAATRVRTH